MHMATSKAPPQTAANICFVIAPIGDPGSETRKRSDQVLKHIIEPVAKECGYEAIRADRIAEPGLITAQVIQQIMDAPLVVADLSEHNPNVFYELAIRHAVGKPLVQIIRVGDRIPFDVSGMRTITFDHQDLDSAAEAKVELTKQIRAVEKDSSKIHSPLSTTINLQSLRSSDQPLDRTLGDMSAAIVELRASVTQIALRLDGSVVPARPVRPRPSSDLDLLGVTYTIGLRNPPNFIDPKRHICALHGKHPIFEPVSNGTVMLRTCCEPFQHQLLAEFAAPENQA